MNVLTTIGKLGVTGAIIAGIGFFVIAQSPEGEVGEVKEAEADIGWFNVGKDGHEFTRAVAKAGLEPRPYDLNGNRMWFAAGRTEQTPNQVESTMQKLFVEEGVNSKNHTGMGTIHGAALAADLTTEQGRAGLAEGNFERGKLIMSGDVVPIEREEGYVSMAGYDWAMSEDEMMDQIETGEMTAKKFKPDNMIKGYKFIDATWEPSSRMTSVTSVWTDQDFDAEKMHDKGFKKQAPDPNIPACMGCERDFRMQSLAKDEPFQANKWTTNATVDQTYSFYVKAMHQRGWKATRSDELLQELAVKLPSVNNIQGRMLNLEKDGKIMIITLLPGANGGTEIISNERYEGAESLLEAVDEREDKSFLKRVFQGE